MGGVCALGEERNGCGFYYVNEMFNIFSKYLHRSTYVERFGIMQACIVESLIHWESIRLFSSFLLVELETKSYANECCRHH